MDWGMIYASLRIYETAARKTRCKQKEAKSTYSLSIEC